MAIKIGCYVLSLAMLFIAAIARPRRARCPSGWWLDEGVRSGGMFTCVPRGGDDSIRSPRGGWIDRSETPPGRLSGRVYCTGGTRAITVDGESVGCQPGGWR